MAAGLVGVLLAGSALAQQPRSIPPRPLDPDAQTNCFEQVRAPSATWCLVSETTNVLVLGHAPGLDRQITIFPLDDQGRVITSAPPAVIVLAKPASLAANSNVAVAAAIHPTLPLPRCRRRADGGLEQRARGRVWRPGVVLFRAI